MRVNFGNGSLSRPLWSTTAKPTVDWYLANVNIGSELGALSQNWSVVFEGLPDIYGVTLYLNDLALDDISFTDCNPDDHLKPLKCDFEVDLCQWSNQQANKLSWIRSNDQNSISGSRPPGDQ